MADAMVVDVREPRGADAPPSVEDETGALVALRLADGTYAFYEHLRPGMIVRVGDVVRRGDVSGRLGASGHVPRPHLHFHVADGTRPLESEGLSYRLASGRVIGRYADVAAFEAGGKWSLVPAQDLVGLPSPMDVVTFPALNRLPRISGP